VEEVEKALEDIQRDLLRRAREFRDAHTHHPQDWEGFREAVEDGFAFAPWCGDAGCEAEIQAETKATNRCLPLDQPQLPAGAKCVRCGRPARETALFARAY
jgi:prolyl-tRNA synthetase